jgi:NAD(P)-dependent dehydrogenase (short-subunit alcohol dehydrogenase family)
VVINNAGINVRKDFTDYTVEDLRSIVSVNIEGFLFITQLAVKQMAAQGTGGSIVNITASMANHPIAGVNVAVPMLTKGGLEAVTRSLAMEYVQQGIRVNTVAPSVVNRPSYKDDWKEFVKTFQPTISGVCEARTGTARRCWSPPDSRHADNTRSPRFANLQASIVECREQLKPEGSVSAALWSADATVTEMRRVV